tara:strand:- start:2539 stop:2772 length:234 start_codon:yes stop_codon:yes gene_type:complete
MSKKDKRYVEMKLEWARRNFNYKQFDKILTETHGGDINEMYQHIIESDEQFESKFQHDQFLTDFIHWMKNRGISLNE